MPASGETFSTFRVSSGFCPLLSWSPRLARSGLAERPARLSFSGQAMMEMEKLLHAAFINGLSGPILFPRPSPKHCLIARTKTLGGRKAATPGPSCTSKAKVSVSLPRNLHGRSLINE